MRITLDLEDALLEQVQAHARRAGVTADQVVEAALQHHLSSRADPAAFRLPVSDARGGLRQGIDPTSNVSLREAAGDQVLTRAGGVVPPVADTR